MKLVKMLTPPIKASVIVFAFLAALSARANSSFDWTGEDGVVTVPKGTTAEVLEEDISNVEALTSIVLESDLETKEFSRIVFKNISSMTLKASITGNGGQGIEKWSSPTLEMLATTGHITFNGKVYFGEGCTIVLGNCTINAEFGSFRGGVKVPDGSKTYNYYGSLKVLDGCTAEFTSTSSLVRQYYMDFYGLGTLCFGCAVPKTSCVRVRTYNAMNVRMTSANILANSCNWQCAGGTVIDLNGFDEATYFVGGGSASVSETPSLVTVSSATPATMTFNQSAYNKDYYPYLHDGSVVFTGAAGLTVATGADYTNRWFNGVSTTTGDLNITGGTLVLDGNAQWAGPTVNVSGGRFMAQAATGGLSADTDLTVGGTGVVEVPDGKVLRVKSLTIDGQDSGLDGIRSIATLAAAYPDFFEGAGAVSTMDGDPRAELSAAMSQEGLISVMDVTPGFSVDARRGGITASAGDEMTFVWEKSPAADTTTYALTVKAEDDAEVSVYVDGGDTPVDTVTAADGAKQVTFSSAEAVRVRLVIAGESGSARFYGFANEISAKIYVAKGGVNVTGASVGTNYVDFGESLSFTIARVFDSDDRIASGLNVNGKFVAFDDLPDATFAWTVDGFDTSVVIETVYDEMTYYVDDKYGDDDKNNGRHSSMAFKTIKHAMELANSGYTIVVAPGTYGDEPGDEVMGSEGDWCRVSIKSGVTLKASGSAAETIILGREATEPISYLNYSRSGTDSARCVTMAANTRIEGFTLTRGCATWSGDTAKTTSGGGVSAANNTTCRIVGCIISNCYSTSTACAGNQGLYLRCYIANCRNGMGYGHGLRNNACAYNCLFTDQMDALSTCSSAFYCTFLTGPSRPIHSHTKDICGCVFTGNAAPDQASSCTTPSSHSLFLSNGAKDYVPALYDQESCRIALSAAQKIGSGGVPLEGSPAIDLGTAWEEYLAMMLNAGWTEEDASVDFAGNPRCLNGFVDAGCYEYDSRGEMSQALDALGFAKVVEVSPEVAIGSDNLSLVMPGGNALTVDWRSPIAEGDVEYSFDAEVSGSAVLKAYLGDSAEPYAVLTAAAGRQTLSVVREGDATVRIEVTGEGEASVSRFDNVIYAIIAAENAGVQVSGDAVLGTNFVASGSSITFTVSRKFDSSERLATGVTVNGEYVSFDEHPEGVTLTVNSKATSVRVDAVYAESLNEVYVDDASGSDTANYGRHPANPFKTIKKALGLVKSGDTVYVAPGVYGDEPDDEVMGELKFKAGTQNQQVEPYGFCRILIPEGVTVKATGTPEETVIVGRKATEILSGGGCGADSARCAFLKGGARLVGFTLTGGYSTTVVSSAGTGSSDGGAAFSATSAYGSLVDCIISNNVASSTGGSGYGLHYFGCCISGNSSVQTYGQGVRYGYLYNCRLKETSTIGGAVSVCYALVNCTFDCPFGSTVIHSADYNVFNSVFTGGCIAPALYTTSASSTSTGTYYNCVFTAPPDAKAWTNGACRVVTATELDLDENGVPRKGSAAVDAGDYAWYVSKLSEYPDLKDRGLLGCQRVYNGALDIGAAEFDWRDTYRGDLGAKRWLAVEAASSNVVETANGAVRLGDGSELTLKFTIARLDGEKFVDIPFVQSGAGTLTATLDGAVIEPKDGAFVLKATAAEQTLVLSYSGEGYADFTKMRRNAGVLLLVR